MVALSAEQQSKTKFYLEYTLAAPAADLARLQRAMNEIPDSWTLTRIGDLISRCDDAYELLELAAGALTSDEQTAIRGDVIRTTVVANRDSYNRRQRYFLDCTSYLAKALGVRNFRDPEQVAAAHFIDGGLYINSIPGVDGNDGLSDYEVAVANGFVGTEQDWLDSLIGPTGPAGNDGADGSDGLSAYEVALSAGFVGTEAAWLDSLIGPTGPAGADGADGLPGAGIDWRGVWNSATAYVENDGVSYQGSAYIANAANTNKTPGVDPEWDLWVAKGEPGADGTGGGGHVIQNDGSVLAQRANLNFKGFKVTDDSGSDSTVIQIADTLTDKAIYWYDAVAKILKPIPIGLDGQALIAKPALNPPYQFATPSGGREVLTADRTYYVRTDGSDSNDGLSNTASGAFLTPQKFQDVLAKLDKNGYNVVCQFANGTYTLTSSVLIKDGIGDGEVTLRGNTATPANVVFTSASNIVYFKKFTNTTLNIEGFKFVNTGANDNTVFLALYAGLTKFKNLDFGAMTTGSNNAQWNISLDYTASVVPVGNFTISGKAKAHALLAGNSVYRDDVKHNPPGTPFTVTLTGTPAFTNFIDVFSSSVYSVSYTMQTFSGSATGVRYNGTGQGLIATGGGGATYFPGNANGTLSGGAIYL